MTPFHKAILFAILSLATFMMVLDYSIANIAIPYIAGDLAVSVDEGIYVITSFAVGNAIGLAMTGWAAKRVGEVRLLMVSIALFTLFSWACGFSPTLMVLVVNRFIQGFVSGPIVPLAQSLIVKYGSPETRARDLSLFATIVVTAPVVGPILGGYLSDWYSWSWIFYINIPIGIFCAAAIWILLRDRESAVEKIAGDWLGIVGLSLAVACLQIFLDKGQEWDWFNSHRIRALAVGAVVLFTFLILYELGKKGPLLLLRLFKVRTFSLSIICLFFSYSIYFGTLVLIPLWLQEFMNYNAEWAGISVAALGIGPVFLAMATPRIIKRIGNVYTLLISFVFFCAACFYSAYFATMVDVQKVAFSRFLFGIGFAYYISPLLGLSVQDVSREDLPNATGMFHFVRAMMGAIGASLFETLWTRRGYFHHERLAESVTLLNPMSPDLSEPAARALWNRVVDQQAGMLAINDAFYLMGWIFLALIVLLFVARPGKKPAGAAEIHVIEGPL